MASIRLAQLKAPSERKTAITFLDHSRRVDSFDPHARRPRPRRLTLTDRTPPIFRSVFPCLCSTSDPTPVHSSQWRIKKIETDEEILSFMQIVLQGCLESSFSGMFMGDLNDYVKSFMRKKLEEEVGRFKEKFSKRNDKHPEVMCLIAQAEDSEEVVAGCEVCVSENLSGICPVGVPVSEKDGFYIQNLIVLPELRRQGLAQLVMNTLYSTVKDMNGTAIYAHVEAQNEPALAFYKKQNFLTVREEKPPDPGANLGRLLLLRLDLC